MSNEIVNDTSTEQQDENKLIAQRREKLSAIRETRNAYPNTFRRDGFAGRLQEECKDKSKEELADLGLQVFARLSLAQFINLDHAQA